MSVPAITKKLLYPILDTCFSDYDQKLDHCLSFIFNSHYKPLPLSYSLHPQNPHCSVESLQIQRDRNYSVGLLSSVHWCFWCGGKWVDLFSGYAMCYLLKGPIFIWVCCWVEQNTGLLYLSKILPHFSDTLNMYVMHSLLFSSWPE